MRKTGKLTTAVLSVAALLASTSGTALAASSTSAPPAAKQRGAAQTGVYPNLFTQAGYSKKNVDARVDAAWQQLFHGAPGTDPNRNDGQSVYYQLNPTMAYVEDIGNQDVRTEGMGYAMMIAVQLNHKSEFDSLWNFAKTKMQLKSGPEKYYFAWHTHTNGDIIDTGVAPDGDQWISAALTFASGRWGNGTGTYNYGNQAEKILHAMWHASDAPGGANMFDLKTYLPVFSPPFAENYTDASYSLPSFYKVFAAADPTDKDLWAKAYTAGEKLLQNAAHLTTGLVPDYSNFDGTPYFRAGETPTDNSYTHNFQEDAWRAIANANIDAEWYGLKPWQTKYSNTLEKFFEKQGVNTYVSRYHLDGTPLTTGQNTYEPAHAQGLVAMNATSAISATNKNKVDFVRDLWNTPVPSGQARYYDGLLYMLGMLYDSGKFRDWSPAVVNKKH